ncbi:MAG: MASE2 domain-containing protein [Symbiopectobacterium sp.]
MWVLLFLNVFVWPYFAYYLSTLSADPKRLTQTL